MTLGINLMLWTASPSKDHAKLVHQLRKVGYGLIEYPIFSPATFPSADIRAIQKAEGLKTTATTCLPGEATMILKDPRLNKLAVDHLKACVDACHATGATLLGGPLYHPVGSFTGNPPNDDEYKRFAENLRKVAEHAGKAKVKLAIEPLNRFETHFANTCAQGSRLAKMVNHEAVGILADTFHMHIEEDDMPEALLDARKQIIHLHASECHRGRPGAGQVRWKKWAEAVRKMKYKGDVVVECFGSGLPELAAATRIWRNIIGDPVKMAEKAAKFLKPLVR
jgi:D-psicose/D-tagatose/L-ribulose 3-epimerase